MTCAKTSHRGAGFTLIELLVALFLLALISVMSWRGFDAMARANEHLTVVTDRWRSIALFFERFGGDVAQPSERAARDAAGVALPAWLGRPLVEPQNFDAQLEFTRKSPPGQREVRLAYRLRNRTIELLVWPVIDRVPASRPQIHLLLEDVNGMRVLYLDAQGKWQDHWPVEGVKDTLPRAVSVELAAAGEPPVQRVFALP